MLMCFVLIGGEIASDALPSTTLAGGAVVAYESKVFTSSLQKTVDITR
jgi:hypothetical protein